MLSFNFYLAMFHLSFHTLEGKERGNYVDKDNLL